MVEELLKVTKNSYFCAFVLLVALAILGITELIYFILKKKSNKSKDTLEELNKNYRIQQEVLQNENRFLSSRTKKYKQNKLQLEELEEEYTDKKEVCEKRVKRYGKVDNGIEIVSIASRTVLCATIVYCFVYMLISLAFMGGSFSDIKQVKDTNVENVSVEAYYRIKYSGTNQKTLSVFVKNDSDSMLKSAKVTEKNTGASSYVYGLSCGEEKIVTLDIYSNEENKYEFELTDLEFVDY